MGKRCRTAAWGATFALLVAACTATEASPNSPRAAAPDSSSTPSIAVPTPVTFPDALADASFVQGARPDGPCVAGDASLMSLRNPATGEETWSFPIPRPGDESVVDGSEVFFSFRWDRGQHPGIAAIDLESQAPLWQRFLGTEVEQMKLFSSTLIVVTSDDVRAIDTSTGADIWIHSSQFDFSEVVLGNDTAYTLDSVGAHAIDFATGKELWELPIERADTLAADDQTLAVAAGTRLVAVDLSSKRRIMDLDVTRLGAGELWVTESTVAYELAPSIAPGGGVAALDRASGAELWRATSTGDPLWVEGNGQLISSTAADEPTPELRFVLLALDGRTGQELWRIPAAAQAFESVVGTAPNRIVAVDPHPTATGLQRVRLINSVTGDAIWSVTSGTFFNRAEVVSDSDVALFDSSGSLSGHRGTVSMATGNTDSWVATYDDGIAQAPVITDYGVLVVSGERRPTCVGRKVGQPSEQQTAVLGASAER